MSSELTFLIVDDHPFFREGLMTWIERQPGWRCCGVTDTVNTARTMISSARPNVVLLDLRLKGEDGLLLLSNLPAEAQGTLFIVLTQSDEPLHAERALRAGARGFILKDEATETVQVAVRHAIRNEVYVSHRLAAQFVRRFARANSEGDELHSLSMREMQVLGLLGSGQNVKEIAEALNISPKTAEAHRDNLRRKLKFADASSLVRSATIWRHEGRI